jgi:hypothetical protein
MIDDTETMRRAMIAAGTPATDAMCAPDLMTTEEMSAQYVVLSFLAPFVVVRRKADGKHGTLEFTHSPRRYFNWQCDNG